jgi:hypothetical protein
VSRKPVTDVMGLASLRHLLLPPPQREDQSTIGIKIAAENSLIARRVHTPDLKRKQLDNLIIRRGCSLKKSPGKLSQGALNPLSFEQHRHL